jgi:hypothetical protein
MVKNERDPPLFTSKQERGYILVSCITVILVDTGGIVDHHRLYKLSLHNVLLLEMPFGHVYCLFVIYPHPDICPTYFHNKDITDCSDQK